MAAKQQYPHTSNADDIDFGFVWKYLVDQEKADRAFKTQLNLAIQKFKGPQDASFMMKAITSAMDARTFFKVELNGFLQGKNKAYSEFDTRVRNIEARLELMKALQRHSETDFQSSMLHAIESVLDNPDMYFDPEVLREFTDDKTASLHQDPKIPAHEL